MSMINQSKVTMPKWVTPERQARMVELFHDSHGFCVFGHETCLIPEHHYAVFIEYLIQDWRTDDRQAETAEWEFERHRMHSLAEPYRFARGRFGTISKEIFYSKQPSYYLVGVAMSGITLTPFAKIRIANSYVNLYVDLGTALRKLSKSARRKAVRYGRPLPLEIQDEVNRACKEAVKHYLSN